MHIVQSESVMLVVLNAELQSVSRYCLMSNCEEMHSSNSPK